jgi:6-phosphogluconolactonase (cycloisomerase 2 family)
MILMSSANLVQITIALAFVGSSMSLCAAGSQLYAVVDGNINVYNVSSNGKLTSNGTVVPPGPVTELAVTPDGRFLYAIREIGDMVEYIVREHGSLQQDGAPFLIDKHSRALHNMLIHPSGRYLFVMDGISVQVYSLLIDPEDGHLMTVTSAGTGIESGALAMDPDGDLLFASRTGGAGCGPGGGIFTYDIGSGGSLQSISDWFNTGQPPLISAPSRVLSADSKFVYLFTAGFCNFDEPPATVAVLRIGENGSLTPVHVYPWRGIGQKIGRFLVLGRDASLFVYSVDRNGALTQTDAVPIQPTSLAGDTNGNRLFVASGDRVVAYRVNGNGRLTLLSDVIASNASDLTFSRPRGSD